MFENRPLQGPLHFQTSEDPNQELSPTRELLAEAETRQQAIESHLRQKEAELQSLRESLANAQQMVSALFIENERLKFWLGRYKKLKDKYLRRGSLAERVLKWIAFRLVRQCANQRKNQSLVVVPHLPEGDFKDVYGAYGNIIAPPHEWLTARHHPPVVIAIPNWNRQELLRACIDSIFANTDYKRHRICVYDQGSTDGSRDYLESLGDRVDSIFAPENVGFVRANNLMIRRYEKWDVVFLNNDTLVSSGWLDVLVQTAYAAENIGVVGPKLVYPDGRLQETGSQVFADGSCRAYGKYDNPSDPRYAQLREVDYCSAACLYVKRAVLDQVGGFDEMYSPAYYEDADLAFKARMAGFKVLCEPSSMVIHYEYASSGQAAIGLMETNRLKFIEKWKAVLGPQQQNLWEAVALVKREKVLLISEIVPAPDRSSGGTRLYELVRLLARHYHVVLAYLGPESLRDYVKPLERLGVTVFYRGYAKAVHNYDVDLRAVLLNNNCKFVFCELFDVAEQFINLIREASPQSVVVIDTYDVHYLREMREAQISRDPILEQKAQVTRKRELQIYSRADLVLTVTEDDRKMLLRENPKLDVAVVPNIHAIPQAIVPRGQRRDLLFVGGFSHRPNVDAVLYFCREILPLLRRRLADVKFNIVGNAPPAELIALGSDSVTITGYVPNLIPYLDSALVSVVPLRFGSGMKGKIGEAMAYGVPVVTTSVGAEGMGLTDALDAMIADDPEEFAERVIRLWQDSELWNSVVQNARTRVSREWSPDAVDDHLTPILNLHTFSNQS